MGIGGLFTVALAVPCEQAKPKVQGCVTVTVAGSVANCITAVSCCGPVLATIVAPAGKTQVICVLVTVLVATNFTGVPGQAMALAGTTVITGFGATTMVCVCGELQNAGLVAVKV